MTGSSLPPTPCARTGATPTCVCDGLHRIADALDRLVYVVSTGQSSLDALEKESHGTSISGGSKRPEPPSRWRQWLEAMRRPLEDPDLTVLTVTDEEGWLREQSEGDEDEDA